MDLLTSQILAVKYPKLNISCTGFENINYGNKKYEIKEIPAASSGVF